MIEIVRLRTEDTTEKFLVELRELLINAFGSRFSEDDWEHGLGGTHLCLHESGKLISHAAVVPRRLYINDQSVYCGYLENVATQPDRQHQSFGSRILQESNNLITNEFELGALSSSSKPFYRKFGWQDWQGPSYVLQNGQWLRSQSEDRGIMILTTKANSSWNLNSRIACEDRPGDAW